jgi:hypothetical protein
VQPPDSAPPPPAAVAPALGGDSAASGATAGPGAAPYASPALRALVAAAARGNRLPPGLESYRAAIESEIAIATRREDATEAVFSVEQVASTLRWTRAGYYDQHVVGDRARQTGFNLSVLALGRTGWASPVLYGNRLRLRRAADARGSRRGAVLGGGAARARAADTMPVVHPLADDRDAYYRYAGGDTVVTIAAGDRRVPIVRVLVEPRPGLPAGTGLFRGELDLDVTRHVLVRMRGRYLVAPAAPPSAPARLVRALRPRAFAYVELVNAERADARGGRYWLPAYQRVEVQLATPALGDARVVARLVSRFRDVAVNDTVLPAADLAVNADSILRRERRRLTRAPADSLGRYAGWRTSLGDATGGAHADDFADVGPAALAPAGPPRGEFFVPRASDFFHFNRVDGPYLGAGARTRFRDLAPGLTLTATAGWAGGARTARGRVELAQRFGAGARAADAPGAAPGARVDARPARRPLARPDQRLPHPARLGLVVRRAARRRPVRLRRPPLRRARAVARRRRGGRGVRGRVAGARAARAARRGRGGGGPRRLGQRAPLAGGPRALPPQPRRRRGALPALRRHGPVAPRRGRRVRPPRAGRAAVRRARRPVGAPFALGTPAARPLGAYTRAEARLTGRRELWAGGGGGALGRTTAFLAARADAGLVAGGGADGPPPQQLFELGSAQGLFGYGYKAFAGDRAAAARTLLAVTGPYLRAPVRVWRFALPAPAPGLAAGAQLGRVEASGAAARASVLRLGFRADTLAAAGRLLPASRPSDGWRAGVTGGMTFFGGGVFVGAVRPVDGRRDRPQGWRGFVSFAQVL